jgi:FkbM family methyltransferase
MTSKFMQVVKKYLINKPASWMSSNTYVKYIMLISGFRLKSYSKSLSDKSSIFFIYQVTHDNHKIFFQSAIRINRFIKGFEHAGRRMWNRYKIDELLRDIEPRTIIDIGANIGEFSYYADKKYLGRVKIFAFDPDPITKQCFENNLVGIDATFNLVALSNKLGEEDFYLKTDSADSSLHKPNGVSVKIKTKIVTLDSFFNNLEIEQPVLLKMDAEGHEPEVLLGGITTLKRINWVSIDAGLERYGKSTSIEVARILVEQGFSEVDISDTHLVTGKK